MKNLTTPRTVTHCAKNRSRWIRSE